MFFKTLCIFPIAYKQWTAGTEKNEILSTTYQSYEALRWPYGAHLGGVGGRILSSLSKSQFYSGLFNG